MSDTTFTINDPTIRLERSRLRAQLRRAAMERLGVGIALDAEDLMARALDGSNQAWGNVLRHKLLIRALIAEGISPGELAAHLGIDAEEVTGLAQAKLIDTSGAVEEIAAEVARRLPDPIAPSVMRPPAGSFATPGITYTPRPPAS